jgi:hypothetical protein
MNNSELEKLLEQNGFVCQPMPGTVPYKVWFPRRAMEQWIALCARAAQQSVQPTSDRTGDNQGKASEAVTRG